MPSRGSPARGGPLFYFFYLTRPLLLREVLRKSSPVPFFTLKEGAPPLSPKSPFPSGDLKPGRPGLYSQASFNCVDSRLHSAEHSNEFDALLSLAREFAHKGLLVIAYAIELRVFYAKSRDCLSHNVRVFDAIEL